MAGPRACLEPCREAVYFLCHFPSGRPDRGLPGALPFGVRTFLPARRTCRDATRGGRLFHCGGLSKIRFRRSRGPPTGPGAACGGLSPPGCSLLAPCQTNASPGNHSTVAWATDWPRSCCGGLSPPGCSLLAPCQTNASPGNHSTVAWATDWPRSCFSGLSPPGCSLLAPCQTNASPGNHSTVAWATDWPRSCFGGLSPPGCSLLAPCQTNASPGNRSTVAWATDWPRSCFGGLSPPGCSLLAPARRTPRQETTRRPRAGHRLAQELLRRSQPAWLLPPRALPDERRARKPLAVRVRATDCPRSCFGGLSPPGCSLLAPCQTNAAPGNHSPSACGPPTAPGAASAVTARLAAPYPSPSCRI